MPWYEKRLLIGRHFLGLAGVVLLLLLLLPVVALLVNERQRCLWRSFIDWETHVQYLLGEGQFDKFFKMLYESFMALADKLELYLPVDAKQSRNQTGISPITHINKLQMCLRWLSGGSYHDVRTNSDVSVAAFYASIHQVVDAIIAHPDLELQLPRTLTAQRETAKSFKNLSSGYVTRGCVGASDGWICPVRVPRKNKVARVRSIFSGHYQRYGVNVQASCDHLSRFTAVTCSSVGELETRDGFNRVHPTIFAACIFHSWCINQRRREDGSFSVEDDDDLIDGLEWTAFEQEVAQDSTVDPRDTSRYRRLYESADLTIDTENFDNPEWVRDALVRLLENNMIMRPSRSRAARVQLEQTNDLMK
ncbi:unnamed protein product [Phytophthora fragariaefolia]|uniref:Unnamed protein product n=1 Tax=Phytophthora fragariaefolia TaxID=1490495 RepID=A0A9W7D5F5_9STRA|nr:unnamed protein product [Phytophthora fragariaefolia]